MHAYTLSYGSYTFDVFPDLEIVRHDLPPETQGAGIQETWRIKGVLRGSTPDALEQKRSALETALQSDGLDLALSNGSTQLRLIQTSDARIPTRPVNLRWDEQDRTSFKGELRFTLDFQAVIEKNSSVIQDTTLSVTQATNVAGRATFTTEGRATLRNDVDNDTAILALTPSTAAGQRRINSRFVFLDHHRVDFSFTDEDVFKALPGGVQDGQYTSTTSRDEQGQITTKLSGFFVGESAMQRALELRPDESLLVSEDITENAFERRVDFSYVSISEAGSGGSTNALSSVEQVTFVESSNFVDHKLKSPGAPTYRQITGSPDFKVTQQGKALGASAHPTPPSPLFSDVVIEREVRYSIPPESGSTAPLETRWRYVMAPTSSISFTPPAL